GPVVALAVGGFGGAALRLGGRGSAAVPPHACALFLELAELFLEGRLVLQPGIAARRLFPRERPVGCLRAEGHGEDDPRRGGHPRPCAIIGGFHSAYSIWNLQGMQPIPVT